MDLLSTKWLSEMEMNDSLFNQQWQHMSSLESFDFKPFPSTNNITSQNNNHNNKNHNVTDQVIHKPTEKANNSNNSSSSSTIISFSMALEKKKPSSLSSSSSFVHGYENLEYGETKRVAARTPEQAQDHVLAERKRREKMTQKFVALSTLIPGLKKLDKATVLGDAINYIKELQERVKELDELKGKQTITIGGVKRGRLISSYNNNNDDFDASSYDENIDGSCSSSVVFGGCDNPTSPEIEVRASEGNVMVRVYCKNQTGVIKDVLGEIENHNLSMISSNVMPFGHTKLHITIIAKMDAGCEVTPKDLADNIRRAITLNY